MGKSRGKGIQCLIEPAFNMKVEVMGDGGRTLIGPLKLSPNERRLSLDGRQSFGWSK